MRGSGSYRCGVMTLNIMLLPTDMSERFNNFQPIDLYLSNKILDFFSFLFMC
jgi:hypothetical protein